MSGHLSAAVLVMLVCNLLLMLLRLYSPADKDGRPGVFLVPTKPYMPFGSLAFQLTYPTVVDIKDAGVVEKLQGLSTASWMIGVSLSAAVYVCATAAYGRPSELMSPYSVNFNLLLRWTGRSPGRRKCWVPGQVAWVGRTQAMGSSPIAWRATTYRHGTALLPHVSHTCMIFYCLYWQSNS